MSRYLTEQAPCILEGIPFDEYLRIDAASSHALGTLLTKSPKHMKESVGKPSTAMDLGTVTHALLLEPNKVQEQIIVQPDGLGKGSNDAKLATVKWLLDVTGADDPPVDQNAALGKQLTAKLDVLEGIMAEFSVGKTICSQKMFEIAQRMRDNVLSKPIGKTLFAAGRAETTFIARDPRTGVLCKIRTDWLPDGHAVIGDVKTAADASFEGFSRACVKFGYHRQAALYRRIHHEVTHERFRFLHIVVENEPPYDCAFWPLDDEAIAGGDREIDRALHIWRVCEEMDYWPGLQFDYEAREYVISPLSLPRWALK